MKARIIMRFEGDDSEYVYGLYPYETYAEKDRVQTIAQDLRIKRGCEVFIEEVKG